MKTWEDATQAEKVERWENVERVLKSLSPHERRNHWNMGNWGEKNECGTIACAAGHCGLDPYFRRRGFKLNFKFDRFDNDWITVFDDDDVFEFFGFEGAEQIFLDTTNRRVNVVIREVQKYVKYLKAGDSAEGFML